MHFFRQVQIILLINSWIRRLISPHRIKCLLSVESHFEIPPVNWCHIPSFDMFWCIITSQSSPAKMVNLLNPNITLWGFGVSLETGFEAQKMQIGWQWCTSPSKTVVKPSHVDPNIILLLRTRSSDDVPPYPVTNSVYHWLVISTHLSSSVGALLCNSNFPTTSHSRSWSPSEIPLFSVKLHYILIKSHQAPRILSRSASNIHNVFLIAR